MRYTQQARPYPHRTYHSVLDVPVDRLCRDAKQLCRLANRPEPAVAVDIHHFALVHWSHHHRICSGRYKGTGGVIPMCSGEGELVRLGGRSRRKRVACTVLR